VSCSFSEDSPPAVSPADFAALTSSQQLTHLDLRAELEPEQALYVFPDQLRLPKLQSLHLSIYWLMEPDIMAQVVACCPNLQALRVDSYGGGDVAEIQSFVWAASCCCLAALSELTSLQLCLIDVSVGADVGAALAALTDLRELSIEAFDSREVGVLLQLTACRQLTLLHIDTLNIDDPPAEADDGGVLIANQVRKASSSMISTTNLFIVCGWHVACMLSCI
jgi:hypothetical protein